MVMVCLKPLKFSAGWSNSLYFNPASLSLLFEINKNKKSLETPLSSIC
jgi:hypothetical protein